MPTSVPRPAGLTDAEALFAELVVCGSTASPTEAARGAGKTEETARMWASRALKRPRVKAYMDALRVAAAGHALTKPGVVAPVVQAVSEVYAPVATAADVMRKLTRFLHADIGSLLEVYEDPVLVNKDGTPVRHVTLSLLKAIENGVTDLIDEIAITDKGIRVKFVKKLDVTAQLIRVLGMEEASEADRAKERTAVADALAKLPPEVLELLATHSLGPARVNGNGNGNGHGSE